MDRRPTAVERAFELAKSGRFASMDELQKALKAENYSAKELEGSSLHKQLRDLMSAARARKG